MVNIDRQCFTQFVQTQEGTILRTLKRDKEFAVEVTNRGLEFTPQSSMKRNYIEFEVLDRVFGHFSSTKSYRPSDYRDITFSASYVLTLIKAYCTK